MSDFTKLEVWEKSYNLTLNIYRVTKNFPRHEMLGLTSQIRRASASISTNIAEGNGRIYSNEYVRFLSISRGSAMEVQNQLMLSKDLGYIDEETYNELVKECKSIIKMLYKLMKSIKSSNTNNNYLKEQEEDYTKGL